jgi:hypothetical protein
VRERKKETEGERMSMVWDTAYLTIVGVHRYDMQEKKRDFASVGCMRCSEL